jgi:hypothetical protein
MCMSNGMVIPCDLSDFLQTWIVAIGIVIVAWLVIVGLTGWLAGRRGRDDGLWAVLALFIGPIALLAVALLPPKPPAPEPESEPPSNDARGGWAETLK